MWLGEGGWRGVRVCVLGGGGGRGGEGGAGGGAATEMENRGLACSLVFCDWS